MTRNISQAPRLITGTHWLLQALVLSLACLLAPLAFSQTIAAAAPSTVQPAARNEPARVVVANRTVTVLRGIFLGTSPADRARRNEETIVQRLDKGGAGSVTTQTAPQGNIILIDGEFALLLTPEDPDTISGETLDAATQTAVQNLRKVIAETRESRDHGRLLRAAAEAAVATLVFVLVVWLVWRIRAALIRRTGDLLESKAADLHVAGAPLVHSGRLRAVARWAVGVVAWLFVVMLAYEWLVFVLTRFAYTRPWGEQLGAFLWSIIDRIGGGVLRALPDLIIAVVIFLLARSVVAAAKPVFDRIQRGGAGIGWLDRDLVPPTRRIFNVVVWLFAIAMAYPYLPGSQSEAFKGISVLAGLMLTLGGSSLVGQGASGVLLMYSRTIRTGEYVRINDQEGTVVELGTFTTKIRTGLGEEISLPNSLIMSSITKNYSRSIQGGRGYVVDTVVTIGYDTPWRQVEAMLIEAASRTESIMAAPPPRVFQTGLSDFYVEYRLVCQAIATQPRPRAEVLNSLHANIQDVFNENGVQIMSPHYLGDPASDKVVPKANWYAAPARKPEA